MRLHPKCNSFVTAAAIVVAAVLGACSTTKATGPANPGNASKGDTVNLSGTYELVFFTGVTVDSNANATLVLTKTSYSITTAGTVQCNLPPDTGTYVAIDTASAAGVAAGTITLTSLESEGGTTQAAFVVSHDTLQVNVSNGGATTNTIWIKQ